ncbi:hypothetical protein [Streptomyces cellulosae]|uniref:hypothetical protein n=1 Tax=Streptomyces cellulosae TaxID=1968 RepID=UPI0004CABE75|nr:hypothetical protein [Streptomyces cellulosae]
MIPPASTTGQARTLKSASAGPRPSAVEPNGSDSTDRPGEIERHVARLATGMPAEFAELLTGTGRAIAEAAEGRATDTAQRLTGRPPSGFRTFAEREMPCCGRAFDEDTTPGVRARADPGCARSRCARPGRPGAQSRSGFVH